MSTTRDTLRKAIEAYTAEGPNDGPNDGPEEKALVELLDAIQAYDDTRESPVGPHWSRVMAAIPVFLSASADQVRDLRLAWEAFEAADKRQGALVESMLTELATPEPSERKPVAGWVISETVDRSDPLAVDVVLEVHETIASVSEADGFVRVRFRVPVAEWDAVLGRRKIPPATDPTRKQIEAYLRQSPPCPTITACPFCAAEGPGDYACDHTSPNPSRTSPAG